MKKEESAEPGGAAVAVKVLTAIAALLACGIAIGTVVAAATGKLATPTMVRIKARASKPAAAAIVKNGDAFFTGIGTVRAPTADTPPAVAVFSIVFPYDPADSAFSEELAAKVREFRNSAREIVSRHKSTELKADGESALKAELLRSFNALLVLGKIRELYVPDFLVID